MLGALPNCIKHDAASPEHGMDLNRSSVEQEMRTIHERAKVLIIARTIADDSSENARVELRRLEGLHNLDVENLNEIIVRHGLDQTRFEGGCRIPGLPRLKALSESEE